MMKNYREGGDEDVINMARDPNKDYPILVLLQAKLQRDLNIIGHKYLSLESNKYDRGWEIRVFKKDKKKRPYKLKQPD